MEQHLQKLEIRKKDIFDQNMRAKAQIQHAFDELRMRIDAKER